MANQTDNQSGNNLTKQDILQLHWENYQLRQSHVWRSLERLILAVVTLWAIPFIKPELFKNIYIILFLPIVALSLSLVGRRLLKAEYNRLIIVIVKFKELLTPEILRPDFEKGVKIGAKDIKVKAGEIRSIMLNEICIGLIVLSFIDLLIIVGIISNVMPHPILFTIPNK